MAKTIKDTMVLSRLSKVIGIKRNLSFLRVSHLKMSGGIMYAIITTEIIPTIVTSANERMAGCLAKISVPIPINMIKEERIMLFLNCASIFFPVRYSYITPSVTKMV